MTRDDAAAWFQLHGPQAALDSHFPGLKVLNVVPLALPAPVIEGEVVADAEVIAFVKQIAADSPEGAALLAEANAIAQAAEIQPKPKPARKAAAPKPPKSPRKAKAA